MGSIVEFVASFLKLHKKLDLIHPLQLVMYYTCR